MSAWTVKSSSNYGVKVKESRTGVTKIDYGGDGDSGLTPTKLNRSETFISQSKIKPGSAKAFLKPRQPFDKGITRPASANQQNSQLLTSSSSVKLPHVLGATPKYLRGMKIVSCQDNHSVKKNTKEERIIEPSNKHQKIALVNLHKDCNDQKKQFERSLNAAEMVKMLTKNFTLKLICSFIFQKMTKTKSLNAFMMSKKSNNFEFEKLKQEISILNSKLVINQATNDRLECLLQSGEEYIKNLQDSDKITRNRLISQMNDIANLSDIIHEMAKRERVKDELLKSQESKIISLEHRIRIREELNKY